MSKQLDRRGFFKAAGAAAGAGILLNGGTGKLEAAAVSHVSGLPKRIQAQPCPTVRVGFIGVGGQGTSHVRNFLNIEGMELRAVCDLAESKVANVQQMCQEKGMAKPEGYFGGPEEWRKLVDRRGPGPGLHRHALGTACPDGGGGDESRQARRQRGPVRGHPR